MVFTATFTADWASHLEEMGQLRIEVEGAGSITFARPVIPQLQLRNAVLITSTDPNDWSADPKGTTACAVRALIATAKGSRAGKYLAAAVKKAEDAGEEISAIGQGRFTLQHLGGGQAFEVNDTEGQRSSFGAFATFNARGGKAANGKVNATHLCPAAEARGTPFAFLVDSPAARTTIRNGTVSGAMLSFSDPDAFALIAATLASIPSHVITDPQSRRSFTVIVLPDPSRGLKGPILPRSNPPPETAGLPAQQQWSAYNTNRLSNLFALAEVAIAFSTADGKTVDAFNKSVAEYTAEVGNKQMAHKSKGTVEDATGAILEAEGLQLLRKAKAIANSIHVKRASAAPAGNLKLTLTTDYLEKLDLDSDDDGAQPVITRVVAQIPNFPDPTEGQPQGANIAKGSMVRGRTFGGSGARHSADGGSARRSGDGSGARRSDSGHHNQGSRNIGGGSNARHSGSGHGKQRVSPAPNNTSPPLSHETHTYICNPLPLLVHPPTPTHSGRTTVPGPGSPRQPSSKGPTSGQMKVGSLEGWPGHALRPIPLNHTDLLTHLSTYLPKVSWHTITHPTYPLCEITHANHPNHTLNTVYNPVNILLTLTAGAGAYAAIWLLWVDEKDQPPAVVEPFIVYVTDRVIEEESPVPPVECCSPDNVKAEQEGLVSSEVKRLGHPSATKDGPHPYNDTKKETAEENSSEPRYPATPIYDYLHKKIDTTMYNQKRKWGRQSLQMWKQITRLISRSKQAKDKKKRAEPPRPRPEKKESVDGPPTQIGGKKTNRTSQPAHLNCIPEGLYYEKQDRMMCQFHSLAMLVGHELDQTGDDAIQWFEQQKAQPKYAHHDYVLNHQTTQKLYDQNGNFTDTAFAFWVFEQYKLDKRRNNNLTNKKKTITTEDLDEALAHMQANQNYHYNGFIAHTAEKAGYDHATVVIRHGGRWYWLDPEKPHRAPLDQTISTLQEVCTGFYSLHAVTSLGECAEAQRFFPEVENRNHAPVMGHDKEGNLTNTVGWTTVSHKKKRTVGEAIPAAPPHPHPKKTNTKTHTTASSETQPAANPTAPRKQPRDRSDPEAKKRRTGDTPVAEGEEVGAIKEPTARDDTPNVTDAQPTAAAAKEGEPKSTVAGQPRKKKPTMKEKKENNIFLLKGAAVKRRGVGKKPLKRGQKEKATKEKATTAKQLTLLQAMARHNATTTRNAPPHPAENAPDRPGTPPADPAPEGPTPTQPETTLPPTCYGTKILTLNVRGIQSHLEEISACIEENTPDIIVLTETKLHTNHSREREEISRDTLVGYKAYFSGTKNASAGVLVAVADKRIPSPMSFPRLLAPEGLNGYICHTAIATATGGQAHILGVYMPEDMSKRQSIYEYITKSIAGCEVKGETLLVCGDWNAVLHPSDRTGRIDEADKLHALFCAENNMEPLAYKNPETRPHTYFRDRSPTEPTCTSRIDDVLCPTKQKRAMQAEELTVDPGGNLDHKALITTCQAELIIMQTKQENGDDHATHPKPRLKPLTKAQNETVKADISAKLTPKHMTLAHPNITNEASRVLASLDGDLTSQNIQRVRKVWQEEDKMPDVNHLARALQCDLELAFEILEKVCDKAPPKTNKNT